MKYQIYLNKETSDFINLASQIEGKKPATTIKMIVEDLVKATLQIKKETEERLNKREQQGGEQTK